MRRARLRRGACSRVATAPKQQRITLVTTTITTVTVEAQDFWSGAVGAEVEEAIKRENRVRIAYLYLKLIRNYYNHRQECSYASAVLNYRKAVLQQARQQGGASGSEDRNDA